jgi:hypothetical protein
VTWCQPTLGAVEVAADDDVRFLLVPERVNAGETPGFGIY